MASATAVRRRLTGLALAGLAASVVEVAEEADPA
jgi:hypothetical protein